MHKAFLLILVFIVACSKPRYTFVSSALLYRETSANMHPPIKRYVIVPETFNSDAENSLFPGVIQLMKENKWAAANKELSKVKSSSPSYPLCQGLYYLGKEDYASALANFNNYKEPENQCLCKLLITDCHYELAKPYADVKKLIQEYQQALDCSNTEITRVVIQYRIKYLKYE